MNRIITGDCLEKVPAHLPTDSVDLFFTSPPYANQRDGLYDGVPAEIYPDWLATIAEELWCALKPTGSFVLNIKEHTEDGERHPYVYRTAMRLRDCGWRLVDEYVWYKTNPTPGHWPYRFTDAWERVYHFTLQKEFKFRRDAVMVPTKHPDRITNYPDREEKMKTGSGFRFNRARIQNRAMVYPSNVIHTALVNGNVGHPAAFPVALPDFFIRLLTDPGDLVVDPFCGSGTTCVAAHRLDRQWLGIDKSEKYANVARERMARETAQGRLMLEAGT